MGRAATLAAVREKYPEYRQWSDDDLAAGLAERFPKVYGDMVPPEGYIVNPAWSPYKDRDYIPTSAIDWSDPRTYQIRGIEKVQKAQGREGAMLAGTQTPETMGETALQAVGAIPAFAAGGALGGAMKVGPVVGRAATAGVMSRLRGEDAPHTAVNVAGSVVGDVGTSLIGKAVAPFTRPAYGLEEIRKRIGKGPDGQVNLAILDKFMAWLKTAKNPVQKEQMVNRAVDSMEKTFGKEVAAMFERDVLKGEAHLPGLPSVRGRVAPLPSELSRIAREATRSTGGKAAATAVTGTPPMSGFAVGGALEAMRPALHFIPGGERVRAGVREITGEESE